MTLKLNITLPNEITKNKLQMKNFLLSNNAIIIERIRLVSYMLIFTYPLFFIVDFFLLNDISNTSFHRNLTSIHLFSFIISIVYILFYKKIKISNQSKAINIYVLLYLLIGVVSSINSQLLTGNITVYLIILFATCAIIPIQPKKLGLLILGNHLLFLGGIYFMDLNYYSLLIKQINSTGAAVIAYVIAYVFYSYRIKDFSNQNKLKGNVESFRRLFLMNPSPLILLNLESNNIVLLNKQARDYFQLQDNDETMLAGSFIFKNKEEKIEILNRLHEKQSIENYVTQQQITPQLTRWAILNFEIVEYQDDPCLLVGVTDVTHLKKAEEELYKQASIDILTGVVNRRVGMERLQYQLSKHEEFILCFIDINHLKQVNDRYGHSEGDELIKTVSEVITEKMDSSDLLFRYGGDEFILVFFDKNLMEVESFWNVIQLEFENISYSIEKPYPISVSHGHYHYNPDKPVTLEEMLENADKEMYKLKFAKEYLSTKNLS